MPTSVRPTPPIAVVALGDPARRDDGIGPRVMGRVRTLIGEIGCIRARQLQFPGEGSDRRPGSRARRRGEKPMMARSLLSALSLPEKPSWPQSAEAGSLVEWIEGGTDARRLDPVLGDRKRVVLLDAVSLGNPPGTVCHWHLGCSPQSGLSEIRHFNGRTRMGLKHLALWLEDELPDRGTDLIGIEPHDNSEGGELSPALLCRLPAICSQVAALMVRVLEEEGW